MTEYEAQLAQKAIERKRNQQKIISDVESLGRELAAERARADRLAELVRNVRATEFDGIQCQDVGKWNWFDARDKALAAHDAARKGGA